VPRDENGADQVTLAAGEAQALLADMAGAIGLTAGSDGFLQRSGDRRGAARLSAPARSCAARHAAVDHEFRPGHVVGRVRGEEQHSIRDVLRLSSPAQRHPGLGNLVRINGPVGPRLKPFTSCGWPNSRR
jgi:hypothetical protein